MTKKKRLLVVEDDPGLQNQLKWSLEEFNPTVVGDREAAVKFVRQEKPRVVITDLGLPPDPGGNTEGMALLREVLAVDPNIKVIVVTGRDQKENALQSIGIGAYDFYQKPVDADTLNFVVERAFKLSELECQNRELLKSQARADTGSMIGCSPGMLEIFKTVEKVASTSVTVLVLGETGTGKGELAKALHAKSDRSDAHLVTINCASIPESLLESELFGHEKGAFTGAVSKKIGKVEYANGGTLFLDEIGDMPMSLQAKILNVLQDRKIVRLGGNEEIPVDVRVICATHQNLKELIDNGLFREDLYYRISEIVVEVPPLRERGEDILLLAQSFLRKFAVQQGQTINSFSSHAAALLQAFRWPGNIRQLENKIKRAVVMSDGPILGGEELQLDINIENHEPVMLQDVRAQAESAAIIRALNNYKSVSETAKSLGITRPTLYNLINKYKLESYLAGNQEK